MQKSFPVAVVTGASEGIGWAIAQKLRAEGYGLGLLARREERLRERVSQLESQPSQAPIFFEACDMGRPDDVAGFAERLLQTFPSIQLLVNNAGIFLPGKASEVSHGALEQMLQVNLLGVHQLTNALLPGFRSSPGMPGTKKLIVNIGSIASLEAYPPGGLYAISKHALRGLNSSLRQELAEEGIAVTGIFPGAVWTPSWAGSGVNPASIIPAGDIASLVHSIASLSAITVVEELVVRPMLGPEFV